MVTLGLVAGISSALSVAFAGLALRSRARGRMLERAGLMARSIRRRRERPSGPPRAFASVASSRRATVALAAVGAGAGLVAGGPPLAVCGAVAGFAVPAAIGRSRAAKHEAKVEAQLAEATTSIAAALRSGLSLQQAIRFASEEGDPPVARALAQVAERESLGVPLEGSLERWSSQEGSSDVRLVASVLQLHHRVGGESPAVLDQVARTVRLRRAAARELRSLTAQARLSGAVLGLLPVGFFAFMSLVSRHDVQPAYSSGPGLASIVMGLALDAGAFLWIRKLLAVAR
jgi:tight adherence protein B